MLYSLPINTFTLIDDKKNKVYLTKISKYKDRKLDKNTENYESFVGKENTRMKNSILKSYDFYYSPYLAGQFPVRSKSTDQKLHYPLEQI